MNKMYAMRQYKIPTIIDIELALRQSGWIIQESDKMNLAKRRGVAVKEFGLFKRTAGYILFVDKKPVGIIKVKGIDQMPGTTLQERLHENDVEKLNLDSGAPLFFVYESVGQITHFIDYRDSPPSIRPVSGIHSPATLADWKIQSNSLRARLLKMPPLKISNLNGAQEMAILNIEGAFKHNINKVFLQMGLGAGKTDTFITFVYRLLKHANAKRILFAADSNIVLDQIKRRFNNSIITNDHQKFTDLYEIIHWESGILPDVRGVYISSIEQLGRYNENTASNNLPFDFFDCIVVDECQRSCKSQIEKIMIHFDALQIVLNINQRIINDSFDDYKFVFVQKIGNPLIDCVMPPLGLS
jgi:type I restriction enzyme R subunit